MILIQAGNQYKESGAGRKKEAKTCGFRLPGWGGCCIPNPWRKTAAPALPGRPASHSRFATAITKETHHQRACLSGFLTSGTPGVNQKRTILRNYPFDADELMQAISCPGCLGLYLPGMLGRTAFVDSGIPVPGLQRCWRSPKNRW